MRLPSSVVAKLYAAGLAVAAACEPAYKPEACENPTIVVETVDDEKPLDQVVRGTNDEMPRPAVAPRYPEPQQAQPQPSRPQPQPVIKKKPPKRQVWASVCGHAPTLMDEGASMIRCGKG